MKKFLKIFFLSISAGFFGIMFWHYRPDFSVVKNLDTLFIYIYWLFLFLSFYLNTIFLQKIFMRLGTSLKLPEAFEIFSVKRLSNYFLTKSGLVTSSLYLKKFFRVKFKKALSYAFYLNVFQTFAWSLLGLTAVAATGGSLALCLLFSALIFLSGLLIFYPEKLLFIPVKPVRRRIEDWIGYFKDRRLTAFSLIVWLGIAALGNLRMILIFYGLGYKISIANIIAINSLGMLSTLVSITPAALGIKEAVFGLSARLLDEDLASAVLAAAIDRTLTLVWVLVFGFYFIYQLNIKLNDRKT